MPNRQPELQGPEAFLQAIRDPGGTLRDQYDGDPDALAERLGLQLPEKPVYKMLELGIITEAEAKERFGEILPGLRDLVLEVCLEEVRSAVAVGPRGGGKGAALSTPLPVPGGWSTMGEVQVGDLVFAADGTPTTVVWKSEEFFEDTYDVVFDDGSVVTVGQNHEWDTLTANQRRRISDRKRKPAKGIRGPAHNRGGSINPQTVITEDILESLYDPAEKRKSSPNHTIDNCLPLQLPNADLPVDPYVLGLWLGDGGRGTEVIGADAEDAKYYVPTLEQQGYAVTERFENIEVRPFNVLTIKGLKRGLAEAGCFNRKHIPPAYMRASASQRLALIQGLMDTDGTTRNTNNNCQFSQKDDELVIQFAELVASMGWKYTITLKHARCQNGASYYHLLCSFNPTEQVYRLPRKAARLDFSKGQRDRFSRRYIVDVVPVDREPLQCIQVAHPSHLYLIGESMIPTHNSQGVSFIEFYLWMIKSYDALNLGGSELQANNVYEYLLQYMDSDQYWMTLVKGQTKVSETTKKDRAWIRVLTASSKSVRSPHAGGIRNIGGVRVERGGLLVIDEEAEADPEIVKAALPTINTARPSVNVRCCFAEGTRVSMKDGTSTPIESLSLGDLLLQTGKVFQDQEVLAIHRRWFEGNILQLSPKGHREVMVTDDHMLFTDGGLELPARLAAEKGLLAPARKLPCIHNEDNFMRGWIAGFFLGDGCIRKGKSGYSNQVWFSVHEDEAEQVASIIYEYSKRRWPQMSGVKGARVPVIVPDKRSEHAVTVKFTCKPLSKMLQSLVRVDEGYAMKSLHELPAHKGYAEGLLKGWLAADGSNYDIDYSLKVEEPVAPNRGKRASVEARTVSYRLAEQMRQIALDLGYKVSISKGVQPEGAHGAGNQIWNLCINSEADSRWWKLAQTQGVKGARRGLVCKTRMQEVPYKGWVYDLTVSNDPTYVANGILAHNSTFHNAMGSFAEVVDNHVSMGYKMYKWDIFDICAGCDCTGDVCESEEKCFREDHYEDTTDPATGVTETKLLHKAYCGGRAAYADGWLPYEEIVTMWRRMKRNHNTFEVEAMGSRPASGGKVIKDMNKFSENISSSSGFELYQPGSAISICVDWGTGAAGLEVWQQQFPGKHVLLYAEQLEEAGESQILGAVVQQFHRFPEAMEIAADIGGGGNYLNKKLRDEMGYPVRDVNFNTEKEAAVSAWNIYNEANACVYPEEFELFLDQARLWRRKNGQIQKGNDHLCDTAVCYFSKFIDELGISRVRVGPQAIATGVEAHSAQMARQGSSGRSGGGSRTTVPVVAGIGIRSGR